MPHQRLKPENFLGEERLVALKNIIPEACADNKINWSTLKDALGGELEDEEKPDEHFGLFWPGKREARRLASRPSKGTLIPVKGEGIKEETTRNIFIEGENLEVLKILRKSYAGRIKMIYIDPPYNTGNDFVYDDDFTEPLNDYLKRTGQIDGEGRPLTTNKKADGRFHSKWLSMMYPRLRLARELLRDDGVIFVSIDDNEVHHLRMMMNEVFGEENFVAKLVWKSGRTSASHFTNEHEYIISFAKFKDFFPLFNFRGNENISDRTIKRPSAKNPISIINFPTGIDFEVEDKIFPKQFGENEPVKILKGKLEAKDRKLSNDVTIEAAWAMKDMIESWLNGEEVIDQKGQKVVRFFFKNNGVLQYEKEKGTFHPKTIIEGITTKAGTKQLNILFGFNCFDFPKPSSLIGKIIEYVCDNGKDLILDFFSGSATTAHAVLDLNREDGGNRKFILVQMPEATDEKSEAYKAGYKNIAEIGKERIRRVIKKIESERKEELPGLSGENGEIDLGFKVFKLTSSNYKPWENYHGESIEKMQELFEEYQVPLVDKWKEVEDGLFTEILLLEGFPLDSIVTGISEYTKNQIRLVKCSFHENQLLVCLDNKLASETIQSLELAAGDTFVCLDTAIDDQAKSRLADKGMIKTI